MSTSPHAPCSAVARHWTPSQVQGPGADKESLLPPAETLVSIPKAPAFPYKVPGSGVTFTGEGGRTFRAASLHRWNHRRWKRWRWQPLRNTNSVFPFFVSSEKVLHTFQYNSKTSPDKILLNHWINLLRKKNPRLVLNIWIYGNTLQC